MPHSTSKESAGFDQFCCAHGKRIERLWNRVSSGKGGWRASLESFTRILHRSLSARFGGRTPSASEAAHYLETLYLEDLALACACSEGIELAWDDFVSRYRKTLEHAAIAIAGTSIGRDLADSLYAELYGIRGGASSSDSAVRRPLFDYFHGRSKLSTWLRAVLAQRHVDALRVASRTESLDSDPDESASSPLDSLHSPVSENDSDPDRSRLVALLQSALTAALAVLDPRDRLRLSYYYAHDLTLAQIGCLLSEHEATASRKLDRTRAALRGCVERILRDQHHLSDAQLHLCLEYVQGHWQFDLTSALASTAHDPAQASSTQKAESHGRKKGVPGTAAPNPVSYRLKQE